MKLIISGVAKDRSVKVNGKILPIQPAQELMRGLNGIAWSGFNWGYGGSGPALLALAILLEVMPASRALRHYHEFKFEVIRKQPQYQDFLVTIDTADYPHIFSEE